jgi:hypothetical protein
MKNPVYAGKPVAMLFSTEVALLSLELRDR